MTSFSNTKSDASFSVCFTEKNAILRSVLILLSASSRTSLGVCKPCLCELDQGFW